MKKRNIILSIFSLILVAILLCLPIFAQSEKINSDKEIRLYPGGMPFGAKIVSNGLTVVKFSKTSGDDASSAFVAGIREGDIITRIDDCKISSIEDFVKQINTCQGKELCFTVLRGDKELCFKVTPKYCKDDGKYKTGIWVKDSTSGIGTVTYIVPDTNGFAGLGHAICDSSTGKPVRLTRGTVMDVSINGVIKGQVGTAGELKGCFKSNKIGTLTKNTLSGVYGLLSANCYTPPEAAMQICPKDELKTGDAYIWCTLDEGKPQKYAIQITNIDYSDSNVKNFKVKITDPALLQKSGGIVQGMSGSPIIQNGRIVGAVTHVLINDPTQGYGIFIENMLVNMPDILL